ncbi:efflux RND transporter permease subunit [Lutimonas saemankumensis]|uniref:efflux RND transporter permease subunit n=1 Tax=Lutimonas saemankumensis TaxID=483016 RepID=UPI001CD653B4|nr:efflux RND transporter permease subunit [Lutimonas saemankumensis]MCA0932105.1 efflux RND transporter permease subunit [Lutimonas saemankumensis]
MDKGFAGKIASVFLQSKLTILLMIIFMIIGVYSSYLIPREEEPQIEVPIADIFVGYPGASPVEIESKVAKPLEKIVSNLPGVEYVYSTSMNGKAMLIVQFYVGEDLERSFVQLYNEIIKHMDQIPQGVQLPLVKTRAIDDVPVLGLTFWSNTYDDFQLKQLVEEVNSEIEMVKGVAITNIIGGRSQEVSVYLDKDKLAENHLDILSVSQMIQASNLQSKSGNINKNDELLSIHTGDFLHSLEDVENLIVGVNENKPVYLHQVAHLNYGAESSKEYVNFGYGKASDNRIQHPDLYNAVTLSVGKQKGGDAMKVSKVILDKIEELKKTLIPDEVQVTVSRNYGATASQKVSELLSHLFIAIISVSLVVMLAMGWRGGLVVFLSVPVTFALTLFSYYFMDYTLNRITLFALVFVTGIVVDDSIIIAENMHRHFKMKRLPFKQAAIYAINEVGNPTILATFTVIAAVLPMAFVSGLMGPYMSPMPIGASIAMLISLFVALTITPYLGYIFLREKDKSSDEKKKKPKTLESSKIYKVYRKTLDPLLDNKIYRFAFFGINILMLLATSAMFLTKSVAVKMLPFDNKNEFQVIIDMPEGTTLERTDMVAKEIMQYIRESEYVEHYQSYTGTASPITFNGLVRHYDLRIGNNMADIQVNLIDKGDRKEQSHYISTVFRPGIQAIGSKFNANIKIVEVPPGPPVLSTLVAEVYGPDHKEQINIARQLKDHFGTTDDVVDIDWMIEADQTEYKFMIDKEKSMIYGISPQQIVNTMQMSLSNQPIGKLYRDHSNSDVGIVLKFEDKEIGSVQDLLQFKVLSNQGQAIPIGDLVQVKEDTIEKSIMRKNQRRVVYVTADMAGNLESPVYALLSLSDRLRDIKMPEGYELKEEWNQQPGNTDDYTVKWDGEWQITFEVFRDLGAAFAVVVIIIYMLLVGWFQSFRSPIVMLIAIPLSLVGIILGHWVFDAYFTATSMIGLIALAGIMVRNSVLLVDFINLRIEEGIGLRQAVIEAGAVRTTPILLTAGTVVIGAVVMLFDPIFQGLAISLLGGTIFSTFLTLLAVPLIYYYLERSKFKSKN